MDLFNLVIQNVNFPKEGSISLITRGNDQYFDKKIYTDMPNSIAKLDTW